MKAAQPYNHVFLGMTSVIASQPMHRLMDLVGRVARSNASVLVTGESGSGKEMVARALHFYSQRANQPWVDLSCAALPEQLLESELFGHEKGAFSGADQPKPGLFELADRGTIFLDEIGELDPRMQVKLLRVLDGVPYYRLGGTRKIDVDVRVIAATNRNLERAVEAGEFRGDLYHRLSQFTISVPSLRARVDDIGPLARHFLAEHDPEMVLADEAVAVLETHRWPGNIRELRNAVVQAAILSDGLVVTRTDVLEHTKLGAAYRMSGMPLNGTGNGLQALAGATGTSSHEHLSPAAEGQVGPGRASSLSLEEMERRLIFEALEATGGHQQKAAARLGISRRTLSRKLKLYQNAQESAQAGAQDAGFDQAGDAGSHSSGARQSMVAGGSGVAS